MHLLVSRSSDEVIKPFPPGVGCINPPAPDASFNLTTDYVSNTMVDFGDVVEYECVDADNKFMSDPSKTSESRECLPGGDWANITDKCVTGDKMQ